MVPAVTMESMFNTTGQNTTNYFTSTWTPSAVENSTVSKWCIKSPEFNKFFATAQTESATSFTFYVNIMMNDLTTNLTSCQVESNTTSFVEWCSLTKDLTGCAMGTMPPMLSFTMGGSDASSGTNWLLWGGVAAGVVVVVAVGVVLMRGRGSDEDYGVQNTE